MEAEDVKIFQREHVDPAGVRLKDDGDLGARTQWAMDLFSCSPRRRAVVARAQHWLWLREEPLGSNADPGGHIQRMLLQCHAKPGDPWCAAFASMCLGDVAIASALALGAHFPAVDSPLPGDVMWFATGGGKGHCGIVLGLGRHEVLTIEGNCQNAVRLVRRARDLVRFSSTGSDLQGTCPTSFAEAPFLATSVVGTR
jgi:hypothetical protein